MGQDLELPRHDSNRNNRETIPENQRQPMSPSQRRLQWAVPTKESSI